MALISKRGRQKFCFFSPFRLLSNILQLCQGQAPFIMALLHASNIKTRCMSLWEQRDCTNFVVFIVCAAMCVDGAIFGVTAPVLPFLIQDEAYVTKDKAPRTTALLNAAFSVADLISAPLCALYVDQTHSHRTAWSFGILLLITGTILFCLSANLLMLIFSQVLQGASSGTIYIICLAILAESVDSRILARYIGLAMSCSGLGQVVGPVVGGVVYQEVSNGKGAVTGLGMGLAGLGVILVVLMKKKERGTKRDGSVVTINSSTHLTSPPAVGEKTSHESSPPTSISAAPAIPTPPRIFRWKHVWHLVTSPRLLAAIYGIFVYEFITTALTTILPLYTQSLFSWTSTAAGLISLCPALATLFGPPSGILCDRYGARVVAIFGLVTTLPSLFCLTLITTPSLAHKISLCVLLVTGSSTLQFALCPLATEFSLVADDVYARTRSDLRATSFCLLNCAMAIGGVAGPFASGYLIEGVGWKGVCVVLGGMCVTGLGPVVFLTGNMGERSLKGDWRRLKKKIRGGGDEKVEGGREV
ncbi:hypothetical protein HBH70_199670 [Parastagonospora nodorum]|nr:hypothetical protein HBH46_171030 [Parastagonospora nodorum]KAH4409046.1 hypothetical protein HBH92_139370 [Parastagonospora nodorum]KAH4419431.1 hypothetical protein HBH93_206640 [Parastagonospora nodorum]KAH4433722.1 hypothetical protein HBH91_215650 [Parastagonospora nodorum]KAH4490128.1 hypothetical protein HBH89_183570 [Parastagonospora nodorum]